jgi:nicotinamidase-related amidase
MRHPNMLDPAKAALVIIDVQEAFRPAMPEFATVATRIGRLAKAASLLGVPIVVTEHYPKGLGHVVDEVRSALPADQKIIAKTAFSCCGEQTFAEHVNQLGASQALLCGLETHVCVCQTASDLIASGVQVHLAVDCVLSRTADSRAAGLTRMQNTGVIVSTMEMALFELMQDAKHPQFRAVHQLLK